MEKENKFKSNFNVGHQSKFIAGDVVGSDYRFKQGDTIEEVTHEPEDEVQE